MAMLPAGCPVWNYDQVPGYEEILRPASLELFSTLGKPELASAIDLTNLKDVHFKLFGPLAPTGHSYYAGNFRGSADFECLKPYTVGIETDPGVGFSPETVQPSMHEFFQALRLEILSLDKTSAQLEEMQFKVLLAGSAARFFVWFLTIHPFADGNGHVGRYLLIGMMMRYRFRARHYSIHPRPPDTAYSERIRLFRRGNSHQLVGFILGDFRPVV